MNAFCITAVSRPMCVTRCSPVVVRKGERESERARAGELLSFYGIKFSPEMRIAVEKLIDRPATCFPRAPLQIELRFVCRSFFSPFSSLPPFLSRSSRAVRVCTVDNACSLTLVGAQHRRRVLGRFATTRRNLYGNNPLTTPLNSAAALACFKTVASFHFHVGSLLKNLISPTPARLVKIPLLIAFWLIQLPADKPIGYVRR